MSKKLTDVPLKLKLGGKRLYLQYLDINIDENLNWKQKISDIAILKANGIYLN